MMPEKYWGFDLPAQEPLGNGMLVTILPVSFQTLNAEMAKPILQHLHDHNKYPFSQNLGDLEAAVNDAELIAVNVVNVGWVERSDTHRFY